MDSEKRTLDDIQSLAGLAKLEPEQLMSGVQCLSFTEQMDNEAVILMEVDASLLDHLMVGDSLVVRGEKTDPAVLCTRDHTYDVREAETSNTLLMMPELDFPSQLESYSEPVILHRTVCAMKHSYLELRNIQPRLKRLGELLHENVYSGWEGGECEREEAHQGKKYTYDELSERIQASEAELMQGLHDLPACLIDGFWRVLDFEFCGRVLESVLALKESESWDFDEIPSKASCDLLADLYHRSVTRHVLDNYGEETRSDKSPLNDDEDILYKMNEDNVCRYYAELLLRPVEKFNLQEFENVWQLAVPDSFKTSLYQLQGLVLVDRDSIPQVIRYYPCKELPDNASERFNALFRTKDRWSLEEITPFIKDLVTEKLKVGTLLNKYTRSSTQSGIKMFNSRKPLT